MIIKKPFPTKGLDKVSQHLQHLQSHLYKVTSHWIDRYFLKMEHRVKRGVKGTVFANIHPI